MFLARLKLDNDTGFNYDYMGNAHYENGATTSGRTGIGKAFMDGDLRSKAISFVELHGPNVYPGVDCVVMARSETIDNIPNEWKVRVLEETFRTGNEKIVGWLLVGRPYDSGYLDKPILILRRNIPDIGRRVEDFINPAIEYLKRSETESVGG